MKRLSLRWRLSLISSSLVLTATLSVATILYLRAHQQLLDEVTESLADECDEVALVLQDPHLEPFVADFLRIETSYRFTAHRYYYQVHDLGGHPLARSRNLEEVALPIPGEWTYNARGQAIHVDIVRGPTVHGNDSILVRSERVEVDLHGRGRAAVIIQVAVSLGAWQERLRDKLTSDALLAAAILAGAFLLIWFVTTASLRPVAAITRKAAQISAKNLHERIPLAGGGDELDELATVLNGMLDRLGSSLQQIEEFSADAAHQLRTPLTRIRGKLDLMLRGALSEQLRGEIETVQDELVRLSRLCSRLLLLGRLELQSGGTNLMDELVDLREIAEELVDQCRPVAHERGIILELEGARTAPARGSRILLVEALLNLLDNAIRWTPAGGSVRVSVDIVGTQACLCVSDTGPGVPAQDQSRIFQPFYRGTASATASEGAGLGLAIVGAITRAHRGRVELIASSREGSVFRLSLPALTDF